MPVDWLRVLERRCSWSAVYVDRATGNRSLSVRSIPVFAPIGTVACCSVESIVFDLVPYGPVQFMDTVRNTAR